VSCEHKECDIGRIARGPVEWCSQCGAWRSEDEFEWHAPKLQVGEQECVKCGATLDISIECPHCLDCITDCQTCEKRGCINNENPEDGVIA
jgi:hypothetical protein